jgi:hypothetical protein
MGYLREAIQIRARRERCWWSWEPHLERSRAVIRAAVAECPTRRKAVLFGAGRLNDIPLEELATAFREVYLVDIVHPLNSVWQRRRFANVRSVTADVTGVVEEAYRVANRPDASLPRGMPHLFCDDLEVDLVVSVNLLSQLPYLPVAYLTRARGHPIPAITEFAQAVILSHLDYLQRLPGTVALLADLECLTLNRTGRVVERSDALYGVKLPWAGTEWIWQLAPRMQVDSEYHYQRRMIGIPNIKRARPAF